MEVVNEPKLLCVPYKDGYSTEKIRRKILKRLQKLERKSSNSIFVKGLSSLSPNDIQATVSNSKYVGFLLKDGRACRMKVSSSYQSKSYQVPPDLKTVSSSGRGESSFQVLSDAEYARRLQAQFDQEVRPGSRYGRNMEDVIGSLHGSISPYVPMPNWANPSSPVSSQLNTNYSPSSPTQNDGGNPAYLPASLTTFLSSTTSPVITVNLVRQMSGASAAGDSMDVREVMGDAKVRFNAPTGGVVDDTPLATAAAQKKREEMWPDMGSLEWLIVKQVRYLYTLYMYV